jgi:hypothetical protein
MKTPTRLCMGIVMAALFVLLVSPSAHAAIRLINNSGKAFTVDIQTPGERLKGLSLPAEFNPALDFKTPPGESRYSLSIILKCPEGEYRWDGQDGGIYVVGQTGNGWKGRWLGYIKPFTNPSNWLMVMNTSKVEMDLEIFYPNGDSKKTKVQAADSSGTANYGVFNSSDGPRATPGEKRPFELKADGQTIYKGTTTCGQVFLVVPGSGAGGCSVYAEGYQ